MALGVVCGSRACAEACPYLMPRRAPSWQMLIDSICATQRGHRHGSQGCKGRADWVSLHSRGVPPDISHGPPAIVAVRFTASLARRKSRLAPRPLVRDLSAPGLALGRVG